MRCPWSCPNRVVSPARGGKVFCARMLSKEGDWAQKDEKRSALLLRVDAPAQRARLTYALKHSMPSSRHVTLYRDSCALFPLAEAGSLTRRRRVYVPAARPPKKKLPIYVARGALTSQSTLSAIHPGKLK